MAVLRGDPLRAKRASVDTGTGEKRVSDTGRAKHTGRGTFVNWQDDLGISTTEAQAGEIREKDAKFQKDIADRYAPLNEAEGKLNTAQGEIDKGKQQALADLKRLKEWYGWNPNETGTQAQAKAADYARKGPPLTGIGSPGDGQSQEDYDASATKAAAEREAKAKQIESNPERYGDETGSWDPYRGQTQFKLLGVGDKTKVRGALIQAQGTLAKNQELISTAQGSVDSQRGILKGHRDTVKGYEDLNKQQWAKVHADYKNRQETMKKILGGMKIG